MFCHGLQCDCFKLHYETKSSLCLLPLLLKHLWLELLILMVYLRSIMLHTEEYDTPEALWAQKETVFKKKKRKDNCIIYHGTVACHYCMLTVSWYSSVYCGTLLKAYHEPTLHQSTLPGLNNRKGYGKRQTLFIYSCLPTEYKRTSYPCTIFTPCSMPSSNSTYVIFQDLVHSSL